jgi:predicted PolB exonuclease-like 3'-5' exonuclease
MPPAGPEILTAAARLAMLQNGDGSITSAQGTPMPSIELSPHPTTLDASPRTAFLVIDTESVPDGDLLTKVKYPGDTLTPDQAIARAQEEARQTSYSGSDFLPVSFQTPVAVCVVRVATDFSLQAITCLDAPHFRSREIVKKFWFGVEFYTKAKLVTFNGRSFDMPMLELAAFRHGLTLRDYCQRNRNRFGGNHLDLLDWLTNYGACRLVGGLNLLAKMLGKPGKMEVAGDQVYRLVQEGKLQEVNDYCTFDTLDTYFVFLRTRVLTGDLSLDQEQDLVRRAREFLESKATEMPALRQYLDNWGG